MFQFSERNLIRRMARAPLHWHIHIVLWSAAIAAGLMVVSFTILTDYALAGFAYLYSNWSWLPFIITPIIGMLVVWIITRFLPNVEGSGIPQVIAAAQLADAKRPVSKLLSIRISLSKICLVSLGLLGGFSTGREGPAVQIAAGIIHTAHRHFPNGRFIKESSLILAGGAAGLAAAFNAPLAGIIFAIEELGKGQDARINGTLISCIILSGIVAIGVLGNYTYFGELKIPQLGIHILLPILVCGVTCGILGGIFTRILLLPQNHPNWFIWQWRKRYPIYFAGLCGLVIAYLGWFSDGTSFGSGYAVTANALGAGDPMPWHMVITKILATIVTCFSGITGGLFAPALAIGAGIGFDVSTLWGVEFLLHPIVALCMTGFMAASTQAPLTSAIIVMEMTNDHGLIISLMTVALIAKTIASAFAPEFYHQNAKVYHDQ